MKTTGTKWLNLPVCSDVHRLIVEFAWTNGFSTVFLWRKAVRLPCERCLLFAAKHGSVPIAEYAMPQGATDLSRAFREALKMGQLVMCKWASSNDVRFDQVLYSAIYWGHLPIAAWALERGAMKHAMIMDRACACGNLRVVKWMFQQGFRIEYTSMAEAAESGNLTVLKFVLERRAWDVRELNGALNRAIQEGLHRSNERSGQVQRHRHVIDHLMELGAYKWGCLLTYAAATGMIDLAEKAKQHGASNWNRAMEEASKNGLIAMCEWLQRNGADAHNLCFIRACERDNLAMMKWHFERGATRKFWPYKRTSSTTRKWLKDRNRLASEINLTK